MSAPTAPKILEIPEVDGPLASGLPSGWLGVLIGKTASGTPLLAKQFAHAAAGSLPVLYYTTYERTEDVVRAFQDFGWSTDGVQIINLADEYFARVLVRDLEVSRARERGLKIADLTPSAIPTVAPRPFNMTSRLLADLSGLTGPFRLVVDSLDFLLEILEPGEVLTVARQLRHSAQMRGGQALVVIQAGIHERRTSGLLEDMADLVVEFASEDGGGVVQHGLTVRKVRNHPDRMRRYPLTVTPSGFAVEAPPAP
ncbi:MAG: RAD55 family ATPase [Thermoplasmata archaeon]